MSSKAQVLKQMLIRPPKHKSIKGQHIDMIKRYNQLTKPLEPLKYKLQDLPENHNFLQPLGLKEELPFHVARSNTNNLPVYSDYTFKRMQKRTVIRHIQGDIDEFQKELSKIVSNQDIIPKVGVIEVKGIHVKSVKLWLTRLGF